MPYDNNGNFIETCGDACISNRFAKDSGNAAKVDIAPAVLCGFGCGGYGLPTRGGMCLRCIKSRGMEEVFPEAAAVQPPNLMDLATLERTQPFRVEAPPVSLGTLSPARPP